MEVTTMSGVNWVCVAICTAACMADSASLAVDLALGISTASALDS